MAEIKKEKDLVNYRDSGRAKLVGICSVNKVCDGNPDRLCSGMKYGRPIGMGGAGQGQTWNRNFQALEKYRLKMRVVKPNAEPDFKADFLGNSLVMPVMVTSVSGVKLSLNDAMSEADFQRNMIRGAKLFGTIGMSGNTVDFPDHPGVEIIQTEGGHGIPMFKPQAQERLLELFKRAEAADVLAIGVDLDGFGSQNWAYRGKPLFRKSADDLRELVRATTKPVIFKGIMTLADAEIVASSGAKAMVISNHGGRVMDWGLGVADVLPEIAEKFKGKILIMADGAIRTGFDVLKVLALGADIVSLGRPLIQVNLGGGPEEGALAIKKYLDYVKSDLRLAMLMTGCDNLTEINKDILIKIS